MTFKIKRITLWAVLSAGLLAEGAQASSVNWSALGPSNFDEHELLFSGFYADTLMSVSDSNANVSTTNGALYPVDFVLDVLLDNVWTNIFALNGLTGTYRIENIPTTSFSYGEITGLRAKGTGFAPGALPMNNWTLGPGFSSTVFTFGTLNPPSTVPIPAALPLLLASLASLLLMRRQRTPAA